jgi:hypothetical protein
MSIDSIKSKINGQRPILDADYKEIRDNVDLRLILNVEKLKEKINLNGNLDLSSKCARHGQ